MTTKEDFTKIVNFMTLRTKTLVIGRDHLYVSHKVKMHFFLCSALISQTYVMVTKDKFDNCDTPPPQFVIQDKVGGIVMVYTFIFFHKNHYLI